MFNMFSICLCLCVQLYVTLHVRMVLVLPMIHVLALKASEERDAQRKVSGNI